ncbi:MAG: TetR/AcrR family transcriptional regulator [Clostridia bacterium]|nr:TetR/AcrR family transcriptional regulator [Clostridia bacterium]
MSINQNDTRVRRTKKLIRQGLVELSQIKSVNKITVKELTDRIEINRGTFYLHYKDVYDLVASIENELYNSFNSAITSVTSEQVLKHPIEVCELFCNHFYDQMDAYSMLLGKHGDAEFAHKIGSLFNEKVLEIFKEIFPNMDKAKYNFAFTYGKFGLVGLVTCWFTEHPDWTPHQVATMWFSLTLSGLWGILSDEGKEVLKNAHNSD